MINNLHRSHTLISTLTPKLLNELSNDNDFRTTLVVVVSGDVIANVSFVYKPNPIIEDIFPLQGIQA